MSGEASMAMRIREKLHLALTPVSLEVIDDSAKHAGHAHLASPSGKAGRAGGTHFTVKVVSEVFTGKSRIDRHRMINKLLDAEIAAGVHALAIEAKAPGE